MHDTAKTATKPYEGHIKYGPIDPNFAAKMCQYFNFGDERLTFKPKRDRTIIYQRNLHVCAESAAGKGWQALPAFIQEQIEKFTALVRWGSPGKARARTFSRIRRQRELGHRKQLQALIQKALIHAVFSVGKYPVCQMC